MSSYPSFLDFSTMKITQNNFKYIVLVAIYVATMLYISRKVGVQNIDQRNFTKFVKNSVNKMPKNPIAVLVVTCHRSEALRSLLEKLLKYRPSSDIPIIVSQDCEAPETPKMIEKYFKDTVEYIKHKKEGQQPIAGKNFIQYSYIAFHYKNALNYMFNERKFETVIIVEDDLDVAPDFFSYFLTLRNVLLKDPTLYCVSAWNHNGSPELIDSTANTLLYRTDFFTGLGWMLTKSLWDEIGPKWPNAFWDDWLLAPEQRKNRQCIRPEVGRTSMTKFGKSGASGGEYYKDYIERVVLNENPVDFEKLDLSYLDPVEYKTFFEKKVSESKLVENFEDVKNCENTTFRIPYHDFEKIVRDNKLGLMSDLRSNVNRNAYQKIVPFIYKTCRVFLVPQSV